VPHAFSTRLVMSESDCEVISVLLLEVTSC